MAARIASGLGGVFGIFLRSDHLCCCSGERSGLAPGAFSLSQGHRVGVGSDVLLGYREARYRIYLPAYRPLSHAALVRSNLEGMCPDVGREVS